MTFGINRQIIEAASWKIVSEFMRRYPGRFRLIQTHPGGGQYNCLSIYDMDWKHLADFNRPGSLHFHQHEGPNSSCDIWPRMVQENPKDILDWFCKQLRLPIPKKLPPSTSETIMFRTISGLMERRIFDLNRWECINGYSDTSMGPGGRVYFFEKFPKAVEKIESMPRVQASGQLEHGFWILLKRKAAGGGAHPIFCLESSGLGWNLSGDEINLYKVYQKNRRMCDVVQAIEVAMGYGV